VKTIIIDGPVGPLEAGFEQPERAAPGSPAALLAHPHPQMGGTMHNDVLDTAARVLLDHGIACLRFNFRGAGGSDGRFDNGDGERDDLRAALAWLRDQTSGPLSFVGYSFGSWVGWRVIAEDAPALERVWLIAPPVAMLDYPDARADAALDVFAGTADEYLDLSAIDAWAARNDATVHRVADANHFFVARWDQLGDAMNASLR
jgi:alpha/beta superfamily hydrolase